MQGSLTVTKALGPMLGAGDVLLLAEAGFTQVQGMEDKSVLRYDGPATYTSGTHEFTVRRIQPETQVGGFADPFSWGYRAVMRATYSNALGPVSLMPRIAFAHDVNGTAPGPISNFVEARKTVTLVVGRELSGVVAGRALLHQLLRRGPAQPARRPRLRVAHPASYSF